MYSGNKNIKNTFFIKRYFAIYIAFSSSLYIYINTILYLFDIHIWYKGVNEFTKLSQWELLYIQSRKEKDFLQNVVLNKSLFFLKLSVQNN